LIVVDASIAAAWLVNDAASEFAARLLLVEDELAAPDLIGCEVGNVLWKRVIRGETELKTADRLLLDLQAIGMTLVPGGSLLRPALHLAVEINHPVYDCLYFALAQQQSALLATVDRRMSAAASRLHRPVALWQG
jgi:predicted nucleic acid-binding protein